MAWAHINALRLKKGNRYRLPNPSHEVSQCWRPWQWHWWILVPWQVTNAQNSQWAQLTCQNQSIKHAAGMTFWKFSRNFRLDCPPPLSLIIGGNAPWPLAFTDHCYKVWSWPSSGWWDSSSIQCSLPSNKQVLATKPTKNSQNLSS